MSTDLRRGILAVAAAFVANGMFLGVWGASLPGLRVKFALDAGAISALLIATGVSAAISMQLSGRIADRTGARAPTFGGAAVQIGALVAIAFAPSFDLVLALAVVMGAANGFMDVAMNALAVHAEKVRGRALMSRVHAFWSVGSLCGAGIVVASGNIVTDPIARIPVPILVVAGLSLLLLVPAWPATLDSRPTDDTPREVGRLPGSIYLLAVMALGFGITEGTGLDWSALHVTEVVGVDPAVGAAGLVSLSAAMLTVRLVGDHLVERFGRRRVVRVGAAVAAVGYVLTSLGGSLTTVLIAWAVAGFGIGALAPQIYGLAGHLGGGRGLARVTAAGYTAFLIGPALIGAAAHQVGIQRAMLVPLASAFVVVVASVWMPDLDSGF